MRERKHHPETPQGESLAEVRVGGSSESEAKWPMCIQEEFQGVKKKEKKRETIFRDDCQILCRMHRSGKSPVSGLAADPSMSTVCSEGDWCVWSPSQKSGDEP